MPIIKTSDIFQKDAVLAECRVLMQAAPSGTDAHGYRELLQPFLSTVFEAGNSEIRRRFKRSPTSTEAIKERSWLVDQLLASCLILAQEALDAEAHVAQTDEQRAEVLSKGKRSGERRAIALMATGGYGRRELFFQSDIDIMVLIEPHQPRATKKTLPDWVPSLPVIDPQASARRTRLEEVASFVLYLLWDLGLKVGHSVRTVEEALRESRDDITIRTNLLESRYIGGDKKLAGLFQQRYQHEIVDGSAREFVQAKLTEWRSRHAKLGASRYMLEPNMKEGKGGLRDLHTLMWLARYCFGVSKMRDLHKMGRISKEELADFRRCRKFMHLVRLHAHDIADRAEERLSFDAQREIADRLDYRGQTVNQAVERFMKRYFLTIKTIGRLTRNFYFMLEAELSPRSIALPDMTRLPEGFTLKSGRLHFVDKQVMQQQPIKIIELFWLSHDLGKEIHPEAWQWVTRNLKLVDEKLRKNTQANALFVQLLCDRRNPEIGLRRMNESGVLGRFISDFGRIVGQMQFDLYHTYTVDEHTIFALGLLHRIENGELTEIFPLSAQIVKQIQLRRALYLGMLCHDIAKGRGGSHAELGAVIAYKLGKRFGFSAVETETAAWLVKEHLLLAMTAFKRDLDDKRTIEICARRVRSLQRLRLLLLLTVADIRAVGPQTWNSWKGSLLRTLYQRTERELGQFTGKSLMPSLSGLKQAIGSVVDGAVSPEQIEEYLDGSDPTFLEGLEPEQHACCVGLWQRVAHEAEQVAVDFTTSADQSITEMTIVAPDHKGLFAIIAGVLAMTGANILHARITTRKDGIVIDRFGIQDMQGNAFDELRRQERLTQRLLRALEGELDLVEELSNAERRYPSPAASFKTTSAVFVDNVASVRFSVIEIECLDRRGLLYDVADTLTKLELNITSAHITTYGEAANDVFYVKDAYGFKLHNPLRQQQVTNRLLRGLRLKRRKVKK